MTASGLHISGFGGLRRAATCFALMVVFVGCSDELAMAPPVEVPFSLYGVFNPEADTQAVAVYPVEAGILSPLDESLDVVVRSRNVASGEVRVWKDSVLSDGDAGFSHVFWSEFRPEYGSTYEVEAVGEGGETSRVEVDVPGRITVDISDEGDSRTTVSFRGGPFGLVVLDVTYELRVETSPEDGCPLVGPILRYTFSYRDFEQRVDGGWDLPLDLDRYVDGMREFAIRDLRDPLLFANRRSRLALVNLRLNVTVGGEEWTVPTGFLDRRVLAHPEALNNVENGLGFVGGGYKYETLLYPSTEAIEEAGMYDYLIGRPGCPPAADAS